MQKKPEKFLRTDWSKHRGGKWETKGGIVELGHVEQALHERGVFVGSKDEVIDVRCTPPKD